MSTTRASGLMYLCMKRPSSCQIASLPAWSSGLKRCSKTSLRTIGGSLLVPASGSSFSRMIGVAIFGTSTRLLRYSVSSVHEVGAKRRKPEPFVPPGRLVIGRVQEGEVPAVGEVSADKLGRDGGRDPSASTVLPRDDSDDLCRPLEGVRDAGADRLPVQPGEQEDAVRSCHVGTQPFHRGRWSIDLATVGPPDGLECLQLRRRGRRRQLRDMHLFGRGERLESFRAAGNEGVSFDQLQSGALEPLADLRKERLVVLDFEWHLVPLERRTQLGERL